MDLIIRADFFLEWLAVNTVTTDRQGQRISDCEVLSPIWDINIIPSLQGSGKRGRGKRKILRVMVKRKQIQNPVLLMWRDHYTHEFTAAILSAQEIYKLKPTIIPSWIKEGLIRPYPCLKAGWVFDGRIWYVEEEDWGMCMTKIHCVKCVWSSQVINEAILKSNNKLIKVFISYLNVCLKYKNMSTCI